MKEQFICEILHHLPSFASDQLAEIKDAIRIVLCKYDLNAKETALQVVDNSSLHYLQIYLESCEQAGKSTGTIELYRFHLSHFLSYANKDIHDITDDDVYTYLYNYRHKRNVSNSYINQIRLAINGFFKWLIKKRILSSNPVDAIDPTKCQKKSKSHSPLKMSKSSVQPARLSGTLPLSNVSIAQQSGLPSSCSLTVRTYHLSGMTLSF